MPKMITPRSEAKVKNSKARVKEFKLFDGGGLYLAITPSGGKLWRLKYQFNNKEAWLSLLVGTEFSYLTCERRLESGGIAAL
jgi:hypothetical protein